MIENSLGTEAPVSHRSSCNAGEDMVIRGMTDEYRVILNPVFLGSGKPLFQEVKERLRLKLSRTKLFGSGVSFFTTRTPDRTAKPTHKKREQA